MRVVVAAPYPMSRAGLTALVESAGLELAGVAADPADLIQVVERAAPDVALLDAGDERPRWFEALREAVGSGTLPPLVLIADARVPVAEALAHGVGGLLLRDATPEEIADAARAVARGLTVLDRRLATGLVESNDRPLPSLDEEGPVEPLTPRERDILRLIARGLTNKAIAVELGISDHTVKFHVGSIFDKLGASSRAEALARAARLGLIAL